MEPILQALPTRFGSVRVELYDARRASILSEYPPLKFRSAAYNVAGKAYLHPGGEWHTFPPNERMSAHAFTVENDGFGSVTSAARSKVVGEIMRALNEAMATVEWYALRVEAERRAILRRLDDYKESEQHHRTELRAIEQLKASAKKRLDELNSGKIRI